MKPKAQFKNIMSEELRRRQHHGDHQGGRGQTEEGKGGQLQREA